jgi:hypothetical protein
MSLATSLIAVITVAVITIATVLVVMVLVVLVVSGDRGNNCLRCSLKPAINDKQQQTQLKHFNFL